MPDPRDGFGTTRSADVLSRPGPREASQCPPSPCPAGMEAWIWEGDWLWGKSWCWGDPDRSFLCRCVSVRVSVMRVSPCGSVGECNAVRVQGVTVHESVDICVDECVLSQCGCGCRCLSVYEWTCMCDYLCEWVWVCCTV